MPPFISQQVGSIQPYEPEGTKIIFSVYFLLNVKDSLEKRFLDQSGKYQHILKRYE
jgi:hypothetical protein